MKLNFNNLFHTLLKHDGKETGGRPAQVGEGPRESPPETNHFIQPTENTGNVMRAQSTNPFEMDRSNIFETSATNQSVPTPSPRQAGSPLFSRCLTPTESQRVSFRLPPENEGSESNSFTEFSGLEMPTYPPPELNSTGCKNRTSLQQMPFQQIVSQPVIAIELPKFWESDIPLWFTTIENTFRLRNIYNETQRYELLLTALDLRYLQKLEHVLADID